jgi:hypothetical protein
MHIKTSDTSCADVLHHIINTHYIQIKYDYNILRSKSYCNHTWTALGLIPAASHWLRLLLSSSDCFWPYHSRIPELPGWVCLLKPLHCRLEIETEARRDLKLLNCCCVRIRLWCQGSHGSVMHCFCKISTTGRAQQRNQYNNAKRTAKFGLAIYNHGRVAILLVYLCVLISIPPGILLTCDWG